MDEFKQIWVSPDNLADILNQIEAKGYILYEILALPGRLNVLVLYKQKKPINKKKTTKRKKSIKKSDK